MNNYGSDVSKCEICGKWHDNGGLTYTEVKIDGKWCLKL